MEEQKLPSTNEALVYKSKKKKEATPTVKAQKAPKKIANDSKLNSESVQAAAADSSGSGNEYRTLRRKYLLLEEESFGLGKELKDVEDEIKAIEEEKLMLLDELVVLEGLIHPSELPRRLLHH